MAATESPPPISEKAPFFVASTIASASAREPLAKLSISNTPTGPFHRMVFDSAITFVNASVAFGPMSRPSQPSGMSFDGQIFVSVSFLNSLPQTASSAR